MTTIALGAGYRLRWAVNAPTSLTRALVRAQGAARLQATAAPESPAGPGADPGDDALLGVRQAWTRIKAQQTKIDLMGAGNVSGVLARWKGAHDQQATHEAAVDGTAVGRVGRLTWVTRADGARLPPLAPAAPAPAPARSARPPLPAGARHVRHLDLRHVAPEALLDVLLDVLLDEFPPDPTGTARTGRTARTAGAR